jgi:hypothetical protein
MLLAFSGNTVGAGDCQRVKQPESDHKKWICSKSDLEKFPLQGLGLKTSLSQ